MKIIGLFIFIICLSLTFNLQGQEQTKPFTLYLIGDAGCAYENSCATALLSQELMSNNQQDSAVIFLGDNIYPMGMPAKESTKKDDATRELITQLNLFKDFKGTVFFVPGNHDWHMGLWKGQERLEEEYRIANAYVDSILTNSSIQSDGRITFPEI